MDRENAKMMCDELTILWPLVHENSTSCEGRSAQDFIFCRVIPIVIMITWFDTLALQVLQ